MPASATTNPAVQTFEDLIQRRTAKELVPFLLALDKPAAIALRKPIQALKKELEEYRKEQKNGRVEYRQRITPEQAVMLALAGFATFSRKEALARSFDIPWSFREGIPPQGLFMQVLRHTRPDWLTELLVRTVRSSPWQAPSYPELRMLEGEGLISYDAPTFATLLGGIVGRYHWRQSAGKGADIENYDQLILTDLRADATLLTRDFPLLFDYDTPVDSASTWTGKKRTRVTWLTLLPSLIASGHLDRADLLTGSLLALRRDFRRPLLTWFKEVFTSLQPTVAERLARQADLVELLAHPLPLVVNFALEQLKDLWTAPGFDPAPLLQYADGLMTRQDLKTALRSLLGQLEKLLKRQPERAPAVAPLAAAALAHADSGVQERAAKLLVAVLAAKKPLLSPAETADLTATIALYADLLAASARPLLAPWLVAETNPEEQAANNEKQTTKNEAYTPLAAFAPDISPATAIAPVADWHELLFLTGPVLQGGDPAAMERWVDGLLRLRGQFPSGYQQQLQPYLKQQLPWVLRDKPAEEVAAGLRTYTGAGGQNGQPDLLLALLIGWSAGFGHSQVPQIDLRPAQHYLPDPLLLVEQHRLAAAESQLQSNDAPLLLLSTPTHLPHWVAPTTLVEKLLAYQTAGQAPDPTDLAVALARCAWQAEPAAAEARALLPQLPAGDVQALLAWLLAPAEAAAPVSATQEIAAAEPTPPHERTEAYGGQKSTIRLVELAATPVPVPLPAPAHAASLPWLAAPASAAASQGKTLLQLARERLSKLIPMKEETAAPVTLTLADALPWLWAVAARTRYPQAELPALGALAGFPGLAHPWQPGWTLSTYSRTYVQQWMPNKPTVTDSWTHLSVPTPATAAAAPSPLLLYSLHARLADSRSSVWYMRPNLPYALALLPHNPEPLHWHVLREACRTDDQGSEARDVLQAVLRALLTPGVHHAAGTSALLAVALVHHAPVVRALALEVLLSAIGTARLLPADLGRALGRLLAAGRAPVPRLTDTLAQTRAISALTDDALRQVLEALLPELPAAPPRNAGKLLAAYADLLGSTRTPVPAAVQVRLQQWSSSPSLKKILATLPGVVPHPPSLN